MNAPAPNTGSVDYRRYRCDQRPRVENDWYVEPAWAVDALLDELQLPDMMIVRDPAAGIGTIVDRCRARGIAAEGSDLVSRRKDILQWDYLLRADASPSDWTICNPPFARAVLFIETGLRRSRVGVAMLLRLAFLEGTKRMALFRRTPLSQVLVFGPRLSMPPGELFNPDVEAKGGSVAFCWMVWRHGFTGRPAIGWLDRPQGRG